MKKQIFVFLLFLCLFTPFLVQAAQNPLMSTSKHQKQLNPPKTGFVEKHIRPIQRNLNLKLAELTHQAKSDPSVIFLILGISFIYGLLHAMGPGHGKIIMTSYFMSKKSALLDGIKAGLIIGITHGGSAIVLISVIYLILQIPVLRSFEQSTLIFSGISYLVLFIIGIYLFISAVRWFLAEINNHPLEHSHQKPDRGYMTISFFTGLVPCPGAAAVIIFSITSGAFVIGILSVFAMSLAMAVTIALFSVIAVSIQQTISRIQNNNTILRLYLPFTVKSMGALIISSFGLILLLGLF